MQVAESGSEEDDKMDVESEVMVSEPAVAGTAKFDQGEKTPMADSAVSPSNGAASGLPIASQGNSLPHPQVQDADHAPAQVAPRPGAAAPLQVRTDQRSWIPVGQDWRRRPARRAHTIQGEARARGRTVSVRRPDLQASGRLERGASGVLVALSRPPPGVLPPNPDAFIELAFSMKLKDDDIRKQRNKLEAQVNRRTAQTRASPISPATPQTISLPMKRHLT
ncbi:hypothetical protein L227DRAFT_260045 [Lentinus tigrinus ALCF2SS1-6]|uniref:Uncharacterized protein n=1 Tax=Lentinus tigrinus ALCF2SS1-6 TaxID=1328759 RepID=A0A5C2RZQ6_9APHY|nr:hypothetical protein L227DRAFT_260045 [Lentinus tigrinus ALCF2SS1-6]